MIEEAADLCCLSATNLVMRRKIRICKLVSKEKSSLNVFPVREKALFLFLHARRIGKKSWLQDSTVTSRIHIQVLILGFPFNLSSKSKSFDTYKLLSVPIIHWLKFMETKHFEGRNSASKIQVLL